MNISTPKPFLAETQACVVLVFWVWGNAKKKQKHEYFFLTPIQFLPETPETLVYRFEWKC